MHKEEGTMIKPIRDLEITLGNRRLNRVQTIGIASRIIQMLCNPRRRYASGTDEKGR